MWELARVRVSEPKRVEDYLAKGYEPFAASVDYGAEILWLKREDNAFHSKPEQPVKRTSRRATPKPKG